jgi:hypothetical protein
MPDEKLVALLKRGAAVWNEWLREHTEIGPNLRADLGGADLSEENLGHANLGYANLRGANLSGADLNHVYLIGADLRRANLNGADLTGADLISADLRGANLSRASLVFAHLNGSDLSRARLAGARVWLTHLLDLDLSEVKGLETLVHEGPSHVGIDTIYRSGGKIPHTFLKGCGVPDSFATHITSFVGQPLEFYSCFVSYAHQDEEFAQQLYSRMVQEGLRVWYAPEEMKGGKRIHEQIDQAIKLYDKLVLILSEASMASRWVRVELRRARKREEAQNRRMLFPIALVPYSAVREWTSDPEALDEDLAKEISGFYIPDFTDWKDHDAFEAAFARLLKDLRKGEATEADVPPEK